jgi:hypothetical protein
MHICTWPPFDNRQESLENTRLDGDSASPSVPIIGMRFWASSVSSLSLVGTSAVSLSALSEKRLLTLSYRVRIHWDVLYDHLGNGQIQAVQAGIRP